MSAARKPVQWWWLEASSAWHDASGTRERLALLEWALRQQPHTDELLRVVGTAKYDPRADRWVGFDWTGQAFVVRVRCEASESLRKLESLGFNYATCACAVGAES